MQDGAIPRASPNAQDMPEPARMNALSPDIRSDGKARKGRISPKVRQALALRIEQGLTWKESAHRAGLSEAGIHIAMTKPHVKALHEQMKLAYIQQVMQKRDLLKARAIEVAEDLMLNAQSEAVRMRAVEFFAGESKQPLVNVQVNAPASAYNYRRPTDGASGADAGQVIDVTPQSPDVGTEG